MGTHNLCFELKYEKYQSFLSENFQFLEVKFSIHLNTRIFVMFLFDLADQLGYEFLLGKGGNMIIRRRSHFTFVRLEN